MRWRCTALVLLYSLFFFGSTAVMAGEKRALLIGINDYFANDAGPAATAGQGWIPADLNGAVNEMSFAFVLHVFTSLYSKHRLHIAGG